MLATDRGRRILRYTLGVMTGIALSQLVGWQLSYIMPILLSMILVGPAFDVKAATGFVLVIFGGCLIGLLLAMTVISYPAVCLLILGLMLFRIFYAANKGLAPFAVIMSVMGITVIPLLSIPSIKLSVELVEALLSSGVIAVLVALVFFYLIPTVPQETPQPAAPANAFTLNNAQAAFISTAVIWPLLALYFTFSWSTILILVFAAILAQKPDLATTVKGGAALVIANFAGGLVAVGIYWCLVFAPEPLFLIVIMGFAALVFAQKIFSDDPMAQLYGSAFTAVLLLVGSTAASQDGNAAEAFIGRVFQITMAALYVAVAFYLLGRLARYRSEQLKKRDLGDTAVVADLGV